MPKQLKTKVMVFGTFDALHKGHLHFFKQAKRLAKKVFLIVSVARDFNVKRIKGRKPRLRQAQRVKAIKALGVVDKAVLGGLKSYLPHIIRERPDIIALGYDQRAYVENLRLALQKRGLPIKIARLKPFRPHLYKSSLVKGQDQA